MEAFFTLLAICTGNSPVSGEFPHKGQWRGPLIFSLICVWINSWVNNREAGDLRRYRAHYDVNVINAAGVNFQAVTVRSLVNVLEPCRRTYASMNYVITGSCKGPSAVRPWTITLSNIELLSIGPRWYISVIFYSEYQTMHLKMSTAIL